MTALAVLGLLIPVGLGLHLLSEPLAATDHRLVHDAVAARSNSLTALAHDASLLGRSWLLIPAAGIFAAAAARWLGWRALAPLLAVLGADGLQNVLKALVQRPRPSVLHLERVSGSSFPSGHATESTAVAVSLVLLAAGLPALSRRVLCGVLIILAAAVGASRVYLGVHYPTDVCAGMVLGAIWAITTVWLTGAGGRGRADGASPRVRRG